MSGYLYNKWVWHSNSLGMCYGVDDCEELYKFCLSTKNTKYDFIELIKADYFHLFEFEIEIDLGNLLIDGNIREWGITCREIKNLIFFRLDGSSLKFVHSKDEVETSYPLGCDFGKKYFFKIIGPGRISVSMDGGQVFEHSCSEQIFIVPRPFFKMYNIKKLDKTPSDSIFIVKKLSPALETTTRHS